MRSKIRIAAGQGFWGDWLEAPVRQVTGGQVDYLMLDYLAEVTMSIMMKQRLKDPSAGYARDFVELMERILPICLEKGIKVLANAGGVNPLGCAAAVRAVAEKLGVSKKLKIGVVHGDDIVGDLDKIVASGHPLKSMDTGDELATIRSRVQSANVYFGAWPMVQALREGADVIITGRVTDTGLTLAPMIYEFGWAEDDWDKLAAGTIAGHIIECGAQCSGGNCSVDWADIPDMANVGFPIVEAEPSGEFVVTKHVGTGGRVSVASVKEQLLYEIGDPVSYITPDCVADFTTIQLRADGDNRVRVSGIRGKPKTEMYKVSVSYLNGFKAVGTLVYTWPEAVRKAKVAGEILKKRLDNLGLKFEEYLVELVGVSSCHGALTESEDSGIPEVTLRVGVRGDKEAVGRFTKEIAPLILTGPPSVTGFAGGRPDVQSIVSYWPALLSKSVVKPRVEVI